jgi:exopolysaccharide production protein ExoQ
MTYIVAALYIIMSTGSLNVIDRMIYGEWGGKPGDKLTEALNLLAIVVSLFLYWRGAHKLRSPQFNRALPLAAAGLLATSVLWSVTPSMTITRTVAYFFLVVGAIGIAEYFDAHQVMRLTALIGGFSAAISLILPDAAYITYVGGLRGPFPGKNQLGQVMVIGVLAGLHGIRVGGRRRFLYIFITLLCTVVAFLSKSATSLLTIFAFFMLHIIGILYIKGGGRRIISLCLTIGVGASLILLMMNIDLIFSFLDKEPTLTGRTDLWPYVIDYIYQRPLLGWGFHAFWMPSNPAAAEIAAAAGWGADEAHNGMLELLLDIGVAGTVFFLFLWIRNLVMAVKCINGPAPEIGVSSLLFMVGILLIGVSERVLMTADGPTMQFFLLGFMCEKELWLAGRGPREVGSRPAALHLGQFAAPREEDAA